MLGIKAIVRVYFIFVLCILLFSGQGLASQKALSRSEKLISSMRKSLNRVTEEIRKATEKFDISLVNCLKQKETEIKNYINASLRNQENLRSAWKVRDEKGMERFGKLIEIGHGKVEEIRDSLKDCYKGEIPDKKRTKVKLIVPEGQEREDLDDIFPPEEEEGETEKVPIVPPASPYE